MSINVFRMFYVSGRLFGNQRSHSAAGEDAVGGSQHQKLGACFRTLRGRGGSSSTLVFWENQGSALRFQFSGKTKLASEEAVRLLFKTKYWILLVFIWICISFNLSITMGMGTYYAKYIIGNENVVGISKCNYADPGLMLMPLAPLLSRISGKKSGAGEEPD